MGTEIANGTTHRQTRFPSKLANYGAPDELNSTSLPWEYAKHAIWPKLIAAFVLHSEIAITTHIEKRLNGHRATRPPLATMRRRSSAISGL